MTPSPSPGAYRRVMRRFLIVPFTVATLAVAGCGSSDTTEADSAASSPSTSTAAAAPAAGGDGEVGMEGIAFGPESITVKVGEKVTWTNNEDVPHNVVAEEGADFQSETFGKDGTFSYTPEKAGTIAYVCTLHPGMDGTITVEG